MIYKCILNLDQEVRLRGNWELFADIHESAPKEERVGTTSWVSS